MAIYGGIIMIVTLREIKESDAENIVKWRNSLNVVKHCIDKTIISKESQQRFYESKVITEKYKQYIVEKWDDKFGGVFSYQIGTVFFKDIDNINKKCEFGMFPSDDVEWNSEGQNIAVKLMKEKAFDEMGMHKIYAYVYVDCEEEIELLESCGFIIEGIFKDEIYDKEGYRDIARLVVINS